MLSLRCRCSPAESEAARAHGLTSDAAQLDLSSVSSDVHGNVVSGNGGTNTTQRGAIVGGVLGGVLGVAVLAVAIMAWMRRHRRAGGHGAANSRASDPVDRASAADSRSGSMQAGEVTAV